MMERTHTPDRPESPRRRAALRRLAGMVAAAYVVPEVMTLSAARAEGAPSAPTAPSEPAPSVPTPSVPDPTDPVSPSSAEEGAKDTCSVYNAQGPDRLSITRSDLERSKIAVEQGYAKPLDQIWGEFRSEYDGKVIGVEFVDRQRNARYRFRAISRTGHLETVTISAQSGSILRIVGC